MTSDYFMEFSRNIRARHNSDVLVGGISFTVLLLVFLGFAIVFRDMGVNGQYTLFQSYATLGLILGASCYFIYCRYWDHVMRDVEWCLNVIGCLDELGVNTIELDGARRRLEKNTSPGSRGIRGLFMVEVALFPVSVYCSAYVSIGLMEQNLLTGLAIWSPLIVTGAMFLSSVWTFFIGPDRHDSRQWSFTKEVANILSVYGVMVEPMERREMGFGIRHFIPVVVVASALAVSFFLVADPAVVMAVLAVLGAVYLLAIYILAVGGMNGHILRQWKYEEYILANLGELYRSGDNRKASRRTSAGDGMKRKMRIPLVIRIAAAYLLIMCIISLVRTFAVGVDLTAGSYASIEQRPMDFLVFYAMALFYAYTFVKNFDALLGIKSKKADAWKKVVTSCILFSLSTIATYYIFHSSNFVSYFGINPFITVAVLYVLFLMMLFSPSVRRFYTPYRMLPPPAKGWVRYLFHRDIEFMETSSSVPDSEARGHPNRIPTGKNVLRNSHGAVVFINKESTSRTFKRCYAVRVKSPVSLVGDDGSGTCKLVLSIGGTDYVMDPGGELSVGLDEGTYVMSLHQLGQSGAVVMEMSRELLVFEKIDIAVRIGSDGKGYGVFIRFGHCTELHTMHLGTASSA